MAPSETSRDKANVKRRQRILDAAMLGFVEKGYHQTERREIAKRAGISLGNLYNHFAGKHEVLAEIAEQEQAELEPFLAMLEQDGPPDRNLDRFIKAYLNYLASPEIVILTLEITCEALRKPDIAALFTDSRNALVGALIKLIKRGIGEGCMRAVPNVEETAHLVIEAIEGSSYRIAIDAVPTKRVEKILREFIFTALAKE